MGNLYQVLMGAPSNTAAPAKVATGTAAKTMLQISTPATIAVNVVEWGVSFDASAAAVPVAVELVDVSFAATLTGTAHTTTTVQNLTEPGGPASRLTMGLANTAFNGGAANTGEGTAAGTPRLLDWQLVAPTNQYVKMFPLGREPRVAVSRFLRIRVTAPVTVNMSGYVVVEEL